MTFEEWWKELSLTILADGLPSPKQVRLLFKDAFETGYEHSGALCSVCKSENTGVFNNYCQTCGAKIEGENDGKSRNRILRNIEQRN